MQEHHKETICDVKTFWNSVKKMLYTLINEKRNSVQNANKKMWHRTCYVCIIINQNIPVIVIL